MDILESTRLTWPTDGLASEGIVPTPAQTVADRFKRHYQTKLRVLLIPIFSQDSPVLTMNNASSLAVRESYCVSQVAYNCNVITVP